MAFVGVALTGLSIGGLQKADLGVDPLTACVTGVANLFSSSYDVFFPLIMAILFVVIIFLRRAYLGVATVFVLLFTAPCASLMRGLLDALFPEPGLVLSLVIMVASLAVICFASALYYTADVGVSAYDAVALYAARRQSRVPFKLCRLTSDAVCVAVGFIFDVTIGIGTLITALFMGPLVEFFSKKYAEPWRYGRRRLR